MCELQFQLICTYGCGDRTGGILNQAQMEDIRFRFKHYIVLSTLKIYLMLKLLQSIKVLLNFLYCKSTIKLTFLEALI